MSRFPTQPPGTVADVALLLEGTYPYVSGGVSSWVHEIVRGLPELRFSIVFIGADRDSATKPKYALPENVVHLEHLYLADPPPPARARFRESPAFSQLTTLHDAFRQGGPMPANALAALHALGTKDGISREAFLYGEQAWTRICEEYEARSTEPSLLDYFWTVRTMHAPLFQLAEVAARLPPAKVFHSVSTGYAGLLGAMLRERRGGAYVITEHGIYTKERRIDLANATWIRDREDGSGYLRDLWIRFFEGLGRSAYAAADPIVALFEGNRRRQVQDGADEAKTRVIPNGIDITRFQKLRARRPERVPPVVGLLGRVVPIKDVRTFIRAMAEVCREMPEAEGWIVGPTEEDPGYANDCRALVQGLGLENRVKFLGFQKPDDILPKLGALVLTSISEALPLVLLEAWASGLPTVATDVGACRELIEGRTGEDRALGAAGAIVPMANPEATARAIVDLLKNEEKWRAAQGAGIARVETHYTMQQMLSAYRAVYRELGAWRE